VAEPLTWPARVTIREVGPRDGIQSERKQVPTGKKIELINALARTGLTCIEAVSFVSPKALPQMADASEVWAGIERVPGVLYSALVPNRRGAERAAACGVDSMQVFVAATDSYNLENVGKPVRASMLDVAEVAKVAAEARIPVEGTISTAFGSPYEGDVSPDRVVEVSGWMLGSGMEALSFGDTTGMATPRRVGDLVAALRTRFPKLRINMHFHDTRGTALANVVTALALGVDYFDSSVGGMGGSPFATGATGNVATEDLVHMVSDMDIATGVNLDALLDCARLAQDMVGSELPGKLLKAGPRDRLIDRPARAG
jgi:hydroxymethylglutaryl-CoA lyase